MTHSSFQGPPDREASPSNLSRIISRWIVAIIVFGIALGMVAAGRASERTPSWVLWDEAANKPYEGKRGVHYFNGPTACATDMPRDLKGAPSGLRISCRMVKGE